MKVLVFGTFDGVHDGHRAMLREAKRLVDSGLLIGDSENHIKPIHHNPSPINYLIVAVAPDAVVKTIKGFVPRPASERIKDLKAEHIADEVVLADEDLRSWKILKKTKPAVIAVGYDQDELKQSLEEYIESNYPEIETEQGFQSNPKKPTIVVLQPHQPERYKSSLLKHDRY